MVDKVSLHFLNTQSLRASFKNLSSGLKVPSKHNEDAAKVETDSSVANTKKMSALVDNLKNAVAHSDAAYASLKKVEELSGSDVPEVKDLAKGLDSLRENMAGMLDSLKKQTETAEVISENISSADSKIEDVEAATSRAEETGGSIKFDEEQAIDAHSSLDPDSVAALLKE